MSKKAGYSDEKTQVEIGHCNWAGNHWRGGRIWAECFGCGKKDRENGIGYSGSDCWRYERDRKH